MVSSSHCVRGSAWGLLGAGVRTLTPYFAWGLARTEPGSARLQGLASGITGVGSAPPALHRVQRVAQLQ